MRPDNEAEFRDFVAARSGALLRTAYLLTGDAGLAEDAVQAMFARVYLAWPRIQRREAAEAYCRRALVREVSSWRRKRQVAHVLTAQVPEPAGSSSEGPPAPSDDLRRALLDLPARQRAVVVLRYYADLPESEVAALLDVSVGTVKQHCHRALQRLRAVLVEQADTVEEADR